MKKLIARLLSWVFYGIGHLCSKLMHYRFLQFLYHPYQMFMHWSVSLQDWGNLCKPWVPEKAILKFNGGNLAILCSKCSVIIKTGKDFDSRERQFAMCKNTYLPPQYCDTCKPTSNER